MSSGAKGGRSCRGWPGCPPRLRLPDELVPARGGLTMSLDGVLEEFEEFFCRVASRAVSTANSPLSAANSFCSASQFGHELAADRFIAPPNYPITLEITKTP